jgi:hypothetical protein
VEIGQDENKLLQQNLTRAAAQNALRSSTEVVRVLAHQQGWFLSSYLVCDHRGVIAYCIEDLAEFAEDQGWIHYDSSSVEFSINWSEIPRPAAVAADEARTGLNMTLVSTLTTE